MNPKILLRQAVRDHSATLVTFEGGKTCVFIVNLGWKCSHRALGGKFYLDYIISGGRGNRSGSLYSRFVECGGPTHFDVNSDVIAVFECDCAAAFPSDYMGLDKPESLFANYIDTKGGAIRYLGGDSDAVFCNRSINACVGYDYRGSFGARLLYCSDQELKDSIWKPCGLSFAEVACNLVSECYL